MHVTTSDDVGGKSVTENGLSPWVQCVSEDGIFPPLNSFFFCGVHGRILGMDHFVLCNTILTGVWTFLSGVE